MNYNAGNPDLNEDRKKFDEFRAARLKKALATVMSMDDGIITLARILAMTGVYRSTLDKAGDEGKRTAGLAIKQMIEMECGPDEYHKLVIWANAEERKIAQAFADVAKDKTKNPR